MRDPQRIEPVLARIREIWMAHPDLRLMQLLENLAEVEPNPNRNSWDNRDAWRELQYDLAAARKSLYNLEEHDLLARLDRVYGPSKIPTPPTPQLDK